MHCGIDDGLTFVDKKLSIIVISLSINYAAWVDAFALRSEFTICTFEFTNCNRSHNILNIL